MCTHCLDDETCVRMVLVNDRWVRNEIQNVFGLDNECHFVHGDVVNNQNEALVYQNHCGDGICGHAVDVRGVDDYFESPNDRNVNSVDHAIVVDCVQCDQFFARGYVENY